MNPHLLLFLHVVLALAGSAIIAAGLMLLVMLGAGVIKFLTGKEEHDEDL